MVLMTIAIAHSVNHYCIRCQYVLHRRKVTQTGSIGARFVFGGDGDVVHGLVGIGRWKGLHCFRRETILVSTGKGIDPEPTAGNHTPAPRRETGMTVAQNIEEVVEMILEAAENGPVFFRFSECIDTDIERAASRNWGTGETEPGISVAEINVDALRDDFMAEYNLADQFTAVENEAYRTNGAYILTGTGNGACSDGYPTLTAESVEVVCEIAIDDLMKLGVRIRTEPVAGLDFASC